MNKPLRVVFDTESGIISSISLEGVDLSHYITNLSFGVTPSKRLGWTLTLEIKHDQINLLTLPSTTTTTNN